MTFDIYVTGMSTGYHLKGRAFGVGLGHARLVAGTWLCSATRPRAHTRQHPPTCPHPAPPQYPSTRTPPSPQNPPALAIAPVPTCPRPCHLPSTHLPRYGPLELPPSSGLKCAGPRENTAPTDADGARTSYSGPGVSKAVLTVASAASCCGEIWERVAASRVA